LISIPLRSAQANPLQGCELKILKAERKNRKEATGSDNAVTLFGVMAGKLAISELTPRN